MDKEKVLVTGANGFIGQALCISMREKNIDLVPVVRETVASLPNALIIENINPSTDWHAALVDVSVVVHLAARVHVLKDLSSDPLRDYRIANVDATLNLASQCVRCGVKRFIYLSSIKVNGESTTIRPFSAFDVPNPTDPYGISKCEAEQGLKNIALQTGLEVVIIRPPLVYGPKVKANFLQLMRLVRRRIPLPLANVGNRRSMVFVGNLVDLIIRCITCNTAVGHTFLVSDGHDVSTTALINSISLAMGKRPMLFSMPPNVLILAANVIEKKFIAERMLTSLQLDIEFTKDTLGWEPPYSFEIGIDQTVKHFLAVTRS
jgi:nucleoside-diphosphate-sugar epimerase